MPNRTDFAHIQLRGGVLNFVYGCGTFLMKRLSEGILQGEFFEGVLKRGAEKLLRRQKDLETPKLVPKLLVSTLLFQPQTVNGHKQHAPIEHLARGRLGVDSWSIFGQFRSKRLKPTKADDKTTENRPQTDSKLTLFRIPTGV